MPLSCSGTARRGFPFWSARMLSPPTGPPGARPTRAAAGRCRHDQGCWRCHRSRRRADGLRPSGRAGPSKRPAASLGQPERVRRVSGAWMPPAHTTVRVRIVVPSLSVTWPAAISLTPVPSTQCHAHDAATTTPRTRAPSPRTRRARPVRDPPDRCARDGHPGRESAWAAHR